MSRELNRTFSDVSEVSWKRRAMLFAGLLVGLFAGFSWASPAHAAPPGTFEGDAFGTFSNLTVGPLAATLGYTAAIDVPCLGTDGVTLSNTVHSLSAGNNGAVLKANTIFTTATTTKTTQAANVTTTSRVDGLNLLNGLVTADAILAVANTTAGATTITSNANGSAFTNLHIGGIVITQNVPPNTQLTLPGIGNVILNKVTTSGDNSSAQIVVEMITINVTVQNIFGLDVGAQIVVAHARSGFDRLLSPPIVVSGRAWAASANAVIGDVLKNRIGLLAFVEMGCQGTNGTTRTNSITQVGVSPVLSLGTGLTTAFGGQTSTGAVARTTATAQNVSLLNGLVSASSVLAVAQTTITNSVRTRSTQGSKLVGLKVLGLPVLLILPNTKIPLPGLGYVILNEQIKPPASSNAATVVNGIHIFITTINLLNLPVGAEVLVAHADAAAQIVN